MESREYPAPDWVALYDRHFPERTDPVSRWVKCMAERMRDSDDPLHKAWLGYDSPERAAEALERTVVMLWECRERAAELEAALSELCSYRLQVVSRNVSLRALEKAMWRGEEAILKSRAARVEPQTSEGTVK